MSRPLLSGILLIVALHAFDELVLLVSMPAISADLGSGNWYGISIASYILTAIIGMSWCGKKIDQRGPLYVMVIALATFFCGIVVAIFAWNAAIFIVARLLQGFGGGIGWTVAFALINLLCSEAERPRTVAAMDIAWVIPSVLAPVIGGFFIDYMHWRWIFALQIIPVLTVCILVLPRIKHLSKKGVLESDTRLVLDACRIAVGMGIILYVLSQPFSVLWVLALAGFAIAVAPYNRFMPERWLSGGSALALPIMVGLVSFIAFYGLEAYQPLYLIAHRNMPTMQAGFLVTSSSVSWMVGSYLSSRLYPRFSHLHAMLWGSCLLLVGVIAVTLSSLSAINVFYIYASWAVAGLGMGVAFNGSRISAMANTPVNKEGFVATAMTLAANTGIGISSGVGGIIKNHVETSGGSLQHVMLAIGALSVVACAYSLGVLFLRFKYSLKMAGANQLV